MTKLASSTQLLVDRNDRDPILQALQQSFGFANFRPGQEDVCRAAYDGRDVLVVMPTGSGKSLCFQLPTVARGGCALVISPLIALMEDQVAKLNALGLRADRIHSGRGRENSRATAVAFRDGMLQFLFIAPERLSVPGFPQFLARVKPSLVAVDEAHCISQWGHDFRPDYRMLRHHLPLLRPAPLIALTATATPLVQDDIADQLGLLSPLRSIQGFRRKNIAIEITEVRPSERRSAVVALLSDPVRRPAIVYAPTRNETDALTAELNAHFPTKAYHAGLTADVRSKVQDRFLNGNIEVIVATIAFGMGIDKPDVRTVVHTALPGSVESYYQEIGRAGRDGAPSRAVLMHSYADRHRHDFFFDRDYPDPKILEQIYALLGSKPIAKAHLQKRLGFDPEEFEKALEKLWIHAGALIDPEENVLRGSHEWARSYASQGDQRSGQLELMLRFASGHRCRMAALVQYFGDRTDNQNWCGTCDFCAPESCLAQEFRDGTPEEERMAQTVLNFLRGGFAKGTGKLWSEAGNGSSLNRDGFEELLGAMARAGLLTLTDSTFEKNGEQIPYRSVRLTVEGKEREGEPLQLQLRRSEDAKAARSRKPSHGKAAKSLETTASAKSSEVRMSRTAVNEDLVRDLKAWRLQQARSQKVPAFRILSDRVLAQIAAELPSDTGALLQVPGIGPRSVERWGGDILELIRRHAGASAS